MKEIEKFQKKDYYNLDMIITIGFRVNSKTAIKFRTWATSVLKTFTIQGYTLDNLSYTILPQSYYMTTIFKTNDEFKIFIDTIKQRIICKINRLMKDEYVSLIMFIFYFEKNA